MYKKKQGENFKSSVFPVLPFSCCFYVVFLTEYAVHSDYPGFLSRLGDAEHKDLKVERPLLLKGEGEVAELRHNGRRWAGTGTSSSAASRDASARSLLSIPAVFSILSTMAPSSAIATQPSHGSDMLGQTPSPLFCPGELPTHPLCAQKNWGLHSCG